MNTYNYPAPTLTINDGTNANAKDNQRTIVPAPGFPSAIATPVEQDNRLSRWSGEKTIWWDNTAKKYYNCNILCKKVEINLCGDGIPSNGRVPNPDGSGNYLKDPNNQQVGTDLVAGNAGYEKCDDGNNVNGDGCSADCSTVEMGFECPRWGVPCNKRCGNGHREWHADPLNPGTYLSTKY